jgi:hypothetical protein
MYAHQTILRFPQKSNNPKSMEMTPNGAIVGEPTKSTTNDNRKPTVISKMDNPRMKR